MEECTAGEARPFAWKDVIEKNNFKLDVRFFVKKADGSKEFITEMEEQSLDILNTQRFVPYGN